MQGVIVSRVNPTALNANLAIGQWRSYRGTVEANCSRRINYEDAKLEITK